MTTSAVGCPQGKFEADASGAATYRIPIVVPPGIAEFQPDLALVYSHRQPNGVLGVGWSLSGLSQITRTRARYAIDNFTGPVAYDERDRYALDGQRLICVKGKDGKPGAVYHTERQSWKRVTAGASPADGFTVLTKKGEVWKYKAIFAAGAGSPVRLWVVESMQDRNGNRIEYDYSTYTDSPAPSPDAGDLGSHYIRRISYSVRDDGTRANRFVDFGYEKLPVPITGSEGGYRTNMSYRLKTIETSLNPGQEKTVVRTYSIAYKPPGTTGRSRIDTITESAGEAKSKIELPPTRMTWQDVEKQGFKPGPESQLEWHDELRSSPLTVNVTGGGRSDLVQLWIDRAEHLHATVYLATPGPKGTRYEKKADTDLGYFPDDCQVMPADVDGDGRTGLLIAYQDRNYRLKLAVCRSNGTGFDEPAAHLDLGQWTYEHKQFFAMDANGNGRTDLVEAYADRDGLLCFRTFFSGVSGKQFSAAVASPPTGKVAEWKALWAMDVNGDGMMDLVRVWEGRDSKVHVTSYISVSDKPDHATFAASVESNLGPISRTVAFLPVDVNASGIQDLLYAWEDDSGLHLVPFLCDGKGGFEAGTATLLKDRYLADNHHPLGISGGAAAALVNVWSRQNQLSFSAFVSSTSGEFTEVDLGQAGAGDAEETFLPGDVNGNGMGDLIRIRPGRGNDGPVVVPYASNGPYPDLLASITNPLGEIVKIEYRPLSDQAVYKPAASEKYGLDKSPGLLYPHPMTPTAPPFHSVAGQANYVVSEYSRSNDAKLNRFEYGSYSKMTYFGARLDLTGRGWEGFKTVTELQAKSEEDRKKGIGRRTIKTYNQAFPGTGTMKSKSLEEVSAGSSKLLTVSSSQYDDFPSGGRVVEVLLTGSRVDHYCDGDWDYAIGHTYAYDDHGNRTLDAYLGYVDPKAGKFPGKLLYEKEAVYRHKAFSKDPKKPPAKDEWPVGFLYFAKVTANANDGDVTRFDAAAGDYRLEKRTADDRHNMASEAHWDSENRVDLTTEYRYDKFGNREWEIKPGEFKTEYEHETLYNTFLKKTTSPVRGLVTTHAYDPRFGLEVSRRDPNGNESATVLDAFGRTSERRGPAPKAGGAAGAPVVVERTHYLDDGKGGLCKKVESLQTFSGDGGDGDFNWSLSYVDGKGRERQTVHQSGQSEGDVVVITDYDSNDKIVAKSLPFFSKDPTKAEAPESHLVRTTYDGLERPVKRLEPGGRDGKKPIETVWLYKSDGLVTKNSGGAYKEDFKHHFYDGKDKVVSVTVQEDKKATTRFEYDPLARLTGATDPGGVNTEIHYDSLDRRIKLDSPDLNFSGDGGVAAMKAKYDPKTGHLASQTDASGMKTSFKYDPLGRVVTKTFGDEGTEGKKRTFSYYYDDQRPGGDVKKSPGGDEGSNGKGQLTLLISKAGGSGAEECRHEFGYDRYGNTSVTELTLPDGDEPFVVGKTFDPQKRVVRETYPDKSELTSEYAFGHLLRQSLDGASVEYPLEERDPSGFAGRTVCGSGAVSSEYTFSPTGQLQKETVTGSEGKILGLEYFYNSLHQIETISGGGQDEVFTYTGKRLGSAEVTGFGKVEYKYDEAGNLKNKGAVVYTCKEGSNFPASGTDGYEAEPDACGRTAKRKGADGQEFEFHYDERGCLSSVTQGGGTCCSMLSDYLGRRVSRTESDGKRIFYVSPNYQATYGKDGSRSVTKYLRDELGVVAEVSSGSSTGSRYFRRDHKGSVTHVFDNQGKVINRFAYSGFGRPKQVFGDTDDLGVKYEHRPWDAQVGLYYFGARYYDPVIGRFLTPDSKLGGDDHLRADVLNRFAFELNDPINMIDPTGHSGIGALFAGIALAVAGIAVIVATGGLATGFVIAGEVAGGAALGAGVSGVTYAASHYHDDWGSKGWAKWGAQVGIGAAVGAWAGGAGASLGMGLEAVSLGRATVSLGRAGLLAAEGAAKLGVSTAEAVVGTGLSNLAGGSSFGQGLGSAVVFGAAGAAASMATSRLGSYVAGRVDLWAENKALESDLMGTLLHSQGLTHKGSLKYNPIGKSALRTRAIEATADLPASIPLTAIDVSVERDW